MYGYDLLDKIPGVRPDNRYASVRPDHRVIAGEQREQLAALMPTWPVVELPADITSTIPVEEYAADAGLMWSEERQLWVHTPELRAAITAEAERMRADSHD